MRYVALLLLLVGTMLLGAGLSVGLPFSGVFLLGFLGTGGREGGRELLMFLPATILCCVVGLGCVKLGNSLRKP